VNAPEPIDLESVGGPGSFATDYAGEMYTVLAYLRELALVDDDEFPREAAHDLREAVIRLTGGSA
jgi:hypothetical protein